MKKLILTCAAILFTALTTSLYSQNSSQLSIQGVLRNANGTAVENGKYDITFRLWDAPTNGTQVWIEEKTQVDVEGGIYSVILGDGSTPLDAKFTVQYFLGVSVEGGTELIPRAALTSSPYALSLIGSDNVFPNSGNVGVGAAHPQHKLTVQKGTGILGLAADTLANNTATITTTTDGMQFDAGGVDKIYAFSNGRIQGKEQFTIEGTDDANIIFSKNSGNATLGFSVANGDDLDISNNIPNGKINLQSDGTISLSPTNAPVKIDKNGEAIQLVGEDSSYISFYPQSTNAGINAKIGYNDVDNPEEFTIDTEGGDFVIDTKDGGVVIKNYLRVAANNTIPWTVGGHGWLYHEGAGSNNNGHTEPYGLVVNGDVIAGIYRAASDQRIKKDLKLSNQQKDLNTLKQIQVTDYRHIDEYNKGIDFRKGLIAQQVKSVFPEAVILDTEFIPSIYSFPTQINFVDKSVKITLKKPHDLKVNDKVKIITPEREENIIVQNINDNFSFSITPKDIEIMDEVFVYGKEVNDFHSVDYDRVFTLAISATQELARKVEILEKENATLKGKSTNTEQANIELKAELKGMNKRLQAIELMIDSSAKK